MKLPKLSAAVNERISCSLDYCSPKRAASVIPQSTFGGGGSGGSSCPIGSSKCNCPNGSVCCDFSDVCDCSQGGARCLRSGGMLHPQVVHF